MITRFTKVSLRNWRNFREVDVEIGRRAFLVGPNASGKSNFLDVFRFLRAIVESGGGFQKAVESRGGVSRLRCLAARKYPNIEIRVSLGDDRSSDLWEYELQFSQDNRQRPIIKKERVTQNRNRRLDRPDEGDRKDTERLTQTSLEQVNVNKEFRDIAVFLETVRYLHVVPQLIREPDRSVGKRDDPYGGDFLEQVASSTPKTQTSRLVRMTAALKTAIPQLESLELRRDAKGTPHLRGRYSHWRPNGAFFDEAQLSDGTLRLMGLLWAVLEGKGPLLLEEPELSLHPGVVRHIPQMLSRFQRRSRRQIILSTHSAELLLDEGIGLDEVLLLSPNNEGTRITIARDEREIKALVEGGVSLPEAIMPLTEPANSRQLSLFGDDPI